MFTKFRRYLLFFFRSTNQHGIHSPFIYDFVTKCLYSKKKFSEWSSFLANRQQLLSNNQQIEVQDFGAGSTIFKTNLRKVSDIAKIAGISKKKGKLLVKIVSYFSSKDMLEIGTSVGISTVALSLGNNEGSITTLEGCPNTASIAKSQFNQLRLKNIKLIVAPFDISLKKVTTNKTLDLIYFDGNHTKEATLRYFETCLKTVHNKSVFIFDDINWSKEMRASWEEIKQHDDVTVTVDTFFWGIAFFRKEQAKEHFIVRV
ncbi:class I SAM-dependent methyltransferase [Flavobacteriaceae bacterium S356]|uniref:Class I SAM-dependent methyltransferase n=1 Tax=Asprobacillus argus TaxID=3076534 RepID=A0ABU3LEM6_9FLAO|nr:class I SAM-dependent methyltransferase [Flavobacteriaceae bacterium S356]